MLLVAKHRAFTRPQFDRDNVTQATSAASELTEEKLKPQNEIMSRSLVVFAELIELHRVRLCNVCERCLFFLRCLP